MDQPPTASSGADWLSTDHLAIFVKVAEMGSFSATGRALGRAQSAISYAIGELEEALGLPLFDRSTRRPRLTPDGRGLLIDAREVLDRVRSLQRRAAGLREGLEAEVSIALDALIPSTRLVEMARWFQSHYPTVSLRVVTEVLGGVAARVQPGDCQLGLTGPEGWTSSHFDAQPAGEVTLQGVVAPSHCVAELRGAALDDALRAEVQVVLSDRSDTTAGKDFDVLSYRVWRVVDLATKHALIRAGLGWGNLPQHLIEAELCAGTLVALKRAPIALPLHLITQRTAAPLGPAARALAAHLSLTAT